MVSIIALVLSPPCLKSSFFRSSKIIEQKKDSFRLDGDNYLRCLPQHLQLHFFGFRSRYHFFADTILQQQHLYSILKLAFLYHFASMVALDWICRLRRGLCLVPTSKWNKATGTYITGIISKCHLKVQICLDTTITTRLDFQRTFNLLMQQKSVKQQGIRIKKTNKSFGSQFINLVGNCWLQYKSCNPVQQWPGEKRTGSRVDKCLLLKRLRLFSFKCSNLYLDGRG